MSKKDSRQSGSQPAPQEAPPKKHIRIEVGSDAILQGREGTVMVLKDRQSDHHYYVKGIGFGRWVPETALKAISRPHR